jgi:transposase
MAPYSMDLRERVVREWDISGDSGDVGRTFGVNRWASIGQVQRCRETGSIAPRQQTKFWSRVLAGQEERLAALTAAVPTRRWQNSGRRCPRRRPSSPLWLEIDRLGLTV